MLQDFHNTLAGNNTSRPRNEYLGFNCNSVEMAGDTYSLNTTLCWVSTWNPLSFIFYNSSLLCTSHIHLNIFCFVPEKVQNLTTVIFFPVTFFLAKSFFYVNFSPVTFFPTIISRICPTQPCLCVKDRLMRLEVSGQVGADCPWRPLVDTCSTGLVINIYNPWTDNHSRML